MSGVLNANGSEAAPAEALSASAPVGGSILSESAAWLTSTIVHTTAIILLGLTTIALPPQEELLDLEVASVEDIELESLPQEFASSDEVQEEIGALAAGGGLGSALAVAPGFSEDSLVSSAAPEEILPVIAERFAVDLGVDAARAPDFSTDLPVQGAGSVGVTGAMGAIDRLTHEILASLEQRPTLVVWLFDESGSLRNERAAIAKRFNRIYEELGVVEAASNPAFARHRDKPLLTAVAGFGFEPELLTPQPTDKIGEIASAIKRVGKRVERLQRDAQGQFNEDEYRMFSQENVFQAVIMCAEKFHAYQSRKQGQRRVMIVVFTDEAGDDVDLVDEAVSTCRKFAMPVYVVGRPAPFGRDTAYLKWVDPDPKFDQRPQRVPIRLGPESVVPETLKLRFVGEGEEELLDSGFGPFALTRLCYDTGGLYFSTHPNRVVGRRVGDGEISTLAPFMTAFFDGDAMRRYQPDYVSTGEYLRLVQSSASRQALIEAAEFTWTTPLENVRLRFPKRDEAELAQSLTEAQRAAALLQPKLDLLCQTLLAGEDAREDEAEPRWQAGYDLAMGRSLAAKARADGYNIRLAEAKQGMPFQEERNNTWVLRPSDDYAASSLEKLADRAKFYLERVVADHEGTPWAMLAERELGTPMGWRWHEDYEYIRPRNDDGGNAPPRREQPPQGPPRRDPPPL
jgi:hypothetical protein